MCVLESRLAELTEALRAKDIEAQQLYETSYVPKTSMGPDAWRPAHQEDIQDIASQVRAVWRKAWMTEERLDRPHAPPHLLTSSLIFLTPVSSSAPPFLCPTSQGLGLLTEMDGLQADVECTGAWLALLSFTRDTLVNAFVSTHKHAVDSLVDFEKESLEKLKTEVRHASPNKELFSLFLDLDQLAHLCLPCLNPPLAPVSPHLPSPPCLPSALTERVGAGEAVGGGAGGLRRRPVPQGRRPRRI